MLYCTVPACFCWYRPSLVDDQLLTAGQPYSNVSPTIQDICTEGVADPSASAQDPFRHPETGNAHNAEMTSEHPAQLKPNMRSDLSPIRSVMGNA